MPSSRRNTALVRNRLILNDNATGPNPYSRVEA